MGELDRVRWQCRRGMLELDLILAKFNDRYLSSLDPDCLALFKELLTLADNELFDLVMGRGGSNDPRLSELLRLIREN